MKRSVSVLGSLSSASIQKEITRREKKIAKLVAKREQLDKQITALNGTGSFGKTAKKRGRKAKATKAKKGAVAYTGKKRGRPRKTDVATVSVVVDSVVTPVAVSDNTVIAPDGSTNTVVIPTETTVVETPVEPAKQSLADAITVVLTGQEKMHVKDIAAAVLANGYQSDSAKFVQNVAVTLSQKKDRFVNVERGHYRNA